MSQPGITYQLMDGRAAAGRLDDLLALSAEVHGRDGDPQATRQARVRQRQPGYQLAEARHGGYLVGYAAGMPLRPSTSWWRELTTPLPADMTSEHPGRTFALTDLLVRASWRRQGIGSALHHLILADRVEERATVTVAPDAAPAQRAFAAWGWRKVARTRAQGLEAQILDVLITDLARLPRSRSPCGTVILRM